MCVSFGTSVSFMALLCLHAFVRLQMSAHYFASNKC